MHKAIQLVLVCIFALLTIESAAQPTKIKKLLVRVGCNLDEEVIPGEYEAIEASNLMQNIYDEIMRSYSGQKPTVQLVASGKAKNAFATEIDGNRYICYNEVFVQNFQTKSRTMWASRFLLAHEIGHHVLGHKFGGKTTEASHRDELEADAFAAKAMARMESDLQETLAGIETFDQDKQASSTHPAPELRKQRIAQAWQEEMSKFVSTNKEVPSSNTSAPTKKFPLALDKSCFKSPWNLISDAKAEIDGEKVIIYFNLPPEYALKKFRVCLKSNNSSIQPGRNLGSVSGSDPSKPVLYSSNIQVVWNYTMDRYQQGQAGMSENLRIYVYDVEKEPKKPSSGGKIGGGTLIAAGLGGIIYGAIEMSNGLNEYNNTYKETRLESDYKTADDRYIKGQALIGGGVILGVVGAIILIRRAHKNKEYRKSVCFQTLPQWDIRPSLVANTQFLGGSIRINF